MQVIYQRCCGLDVHKKTVVATVLITSPDGTIEKKTRTFSTMTTSLLALCDWVGFLWSQPSGDGIHRHLLETDLSFVGRGAYHPAGQRTAQEQRPQAYGMLQQVDHFAQIVGPSLAAPLYLALGPTWAISLNALSFLISFLVILLIDIPSSERSETPKPTDFWQAFREGWRFFVGNRVLASLTVTGMMVMFGSTAYTSLEYLYGSENLHMPAHLLGLFAGCYGVGVVIGLPLMVPLAKRMSEVELLWISLIANGSDNREVIRVGGRQPFAPYHPALSLHFTIKKCITERSPIVPSPTISMEGSNRLDILRGSVPQNDLLL
jgi:MFS family permease